MAKKFNDWNSYLEDYYRRQREASGVTEQDHANYRAYYVSQQDGETLRQEAEAARDNLISAPRKVTSTHKALIDYSAALSKLDNYIALGGTVNGANNQYMQSLYDQYNKSWEEMQRMVQTNRQGFGNLGMQTAAGIAPNGVQVNQDALMGAFMPGRGLIDPKTGVPTEANQRAAQENAMRRQYQDIQSEAGQEAARWGAQAESAAGEKERVDKWMGIVSNLPETTDARIIASNEAWMRQAAEELGIESYTDKNDLLRKIRVQSQIFGAENTTATGRAEDYAAQQQTARAYEYQLDNPDESINANYYLALRDQAGRDAKTVDGFMDFLETPQEIGNWLRYNSAYGNQLYMDQKNQDILSIRENPTTGPIYQAALEASRVSGEVSALRAQAHGEIRENGVISEQTAASIRDLAQQYGVTVGQGDAALESALEQIHQWQSHTVNTNLARLSAQGYDPERLRQYIEQTLNEQRMDERNAAAREFAAERPGAASVGSSLTNVLSGGGYLATMPQAAGNMLAGITGNYDKYIPIDTNSVAFDQAQYVMNVRDEVTKRIVESGGSDFLYGVGMSMLDNVVQMAVGALTFGAPAMAGAAGQGAGAMLQAGISAASPATLSLMGMGAASQQLTKLTEEGVPSGQAYLLATLAGGVEIVTEKIGIDNLASALGRRQASQMLRNIVQQSIAEGAEEGLAEISNLASDYLVRLDDSEIMQMIEEGRQMGLTEEQARERARQTFTRQLMDAIAAGALSGLGFGGGAVVTHAASNTAGARGRQILAQDSLPQLQQQARYYGIDAAGITEESTARDIGSLYKQVEQAAQGAEQELRTWAADHKYNKDGTAALLHTFTEYTGTGAGKMSAREFSIAFDTAYQHGKSDAQFGAEGAYLERAANDGLTAGLTDSTVAYAYHAGIEAGKKLPKVKAQSVKQAVRETKRSAKTNTTPLAEGVMQVERMDDNDAVLVLPDGNRKNITAMDVKGTAAEIVSEAMEDGYTPVIVNQMLKNYDGNMAPKEYYEQFRAAMDAGIGGESLAQAKKAAAGLPAAVAKEAHDRGRLLGKAYDLADRIGSAGEMALDQFGYAAPAEFEKFYKAGLEGKSFRQAEKELGKVSDQIRDEMQAAVNAGLRDKQGGFEYGRQSDGNRAERKADVDPGQRSGRMAEGTVDESGRARPAQSRSAGAAEGQNTGTAEKVSAKTLGLEDGTERATARRIHADRLTAEQKAKVQEYANDGAELVLIEGMLEIQGDAGTAFARGAQTGDRIIASVSDPGASWEQIARHEAKHRYFQKHPGALQQEWDQVTSYMSQEDIDRWLAAYAEQYAALSDDITVEYLMEEALCDLAADIDYLEATEAGYEALEEVKGRRQNSDIGNGARYLFAGEHSLLANMSKLQMAWHKRWQGESKEKILQETGWFLAADGKWRYEIDDSEIKVNRLKALLKGSVTEVSLKEVLEHDALYQAYPNIGDINIRFAALPKGNTGRYSESRNQILLSYDRALNADLLKRTLIHEIQHAIQYIEGFALGGSKSKVATYLFNENYDRYKSTPEALNATSWRELQEAILHHTANRMGYSEISDMLSAAYASLLGEGEARASASRQGLTAEDRKDNPPIVQGSIIVRNHDFEAQRMQRIALKWKRATGIDVPKKLDYDVSGGVNNEVNLQRETRTIHGNGEKNSKTLQANKQTPDGTDKKGPKSTDNRRNVKRPESEKGAYRTESAGRTDRYSRENVEHETTRYSIAGRNAATANLEALEQAEDLEVNGYTPGEIYRETGWFRGADGQWRFEIDDSTMRYTPERMALRLARGEAYLDDVIEHPALFEAYPALREVAVAFAPMRKGAQGVFRRRENKIYLSDSLKNEPESTLIHEIQHAIQALEGFANGSSRAYWEQIVEQGGKIDSVRLRDANAAVWQFEADPANQAVIEAQRRLNEVWDKEGARAGNAVYAQLEAEGLAARVDEYEDLLYEQANAGVVYLSSFPTDLYENTAGEQEARDVQERRNMTAEQRRQTMPQTGTRDTVFAETSEAAMSEEAELTPEQELEAAQKRIKQLERINKSLREQMKITPDYTPDARQITKAAKTLMAEYGGSWSQKEMEAKLADLWKTAAQRSKGEVSFDALMEQTRRLASELVQNYLDKDNQDAETIREIKQYVRSTRIYLSPDLRADLDHYGGYNTVRRANFGKIRLANSGAGVDQLYMELQEQYPAYFPDSIWNPADQLMQIIDVINDGTQILQRSPLDGMPDAMDYMTNKVLWELGLVKAAPPTKADKILEEAGKRSNRDQILQAAGAHEQEQMDQLESYYKQQLQKVKNDREDKIRQVQEKYRQKAQEERDWKAEQEVKRKLLYHAAKLKRMGRKTSPEQQRQIEEIFGDINTLCQKMTGYTVVREYVQGMSTEGMDAVAYKDLENPRRKMSTEEAEVWPIMAGDKYVDTEDLKKWYDDQKRNNPDFIPDKRIEEILASWDAKQINMMTVQEAQALLDVALNIENEIRTQKQLIDAQDRREVYQQVQEVIGNVQSTRGKYDRLLSRGFTGWITENTLSPVRMIQRLTGYHDDDPMYRATIALQQGEMKMLDYQRRAYEMFKPFSEDKAFMDYLAGKGRKQQPLTIGGMDEQGNIIEVKITPDMRVALYLHSLNYQNLRHIQRGGLTIPNYEAYVAGRMEEAYDRAIRLRLTPSQVRQITSHMTEREMAYAKRLEKYFNVMSKTEINETSVKLKGYEIAKTNHYYPIETNKEFVVKEFDSLKFDGSLENMGFTKERIEGGNPILLGNASTTLARSVKQHSMYTGLAIPLRNFNKLRGVSLVKSDEAGAVKYQADSLMDTLRRKWGKSGLNYIEKMVADLSGVKPQQESGMELLNKLRSNYAGAVLELNPSTAMKQLIAYPSAASILGWDAMAVGLNKWERVNLEEINRYTPLLWHRMQGYIDSDIGDYVAQKKHKPRGLNWNQAVDVAVVKRIWKAAEWKVAHDNRQLMQDRDAWMKATAELFNQVMLQSQANYTTMQRGQILRTDNVFLRSLAMFKTEPFQQFNVLYDAFSNEAAKRRQLEAAREAAQDPADDAAKAKVQELEQAHRAAKQRIAQAVPAALTSNLLEALITFAWAFFRGKEDDWEDEESGEITAGSFFKRMAMRTAANLGGMVPVGAELAEAISAVIMGDQYYGIENMETSVIADALSNFVSFSNTVKGWMKKPEEGEERQQEAYDIVLEILDQGLKLGTLLGIPTENVAKTLKAVTRWALIAAMGEAEGDYWYRRFTSQTTGSGHSKEDLDALYEVALTGDPERYQRLLASILRYKDEESVESGLVSRIKAATMEGQIDAETAMRLLQQVTGSEDPDELYWKVQGWDYMSQSGADSFSKYDPVFDAIYDGSGFEAAYQQLLDHGVSESDARSEIRSQIGAWYKGTSTDELTITEQQALQMLQTYGGKSAEDAAALVSEWKCFVDTGIAYNDIKTSVLDGTITANQAEDMLQRYGGKTADEAAAAAAAYEFMRQHPELAEEYEPGFVQTVAEKYTKYGSGINVNVFAEFIKFAKGTDAGKTEIANYIAAIPGLTSAQRDNLMRAGWRNYDEFWGVPW